ncbi:MAG: CehA/McbA family metallohydrolase [Bryobacterales bacterium]
MPALLFAAWALVPDASSRPAGELRWFKGNLHTHTINSDGDSAPDAVARWYKERRYHFLALTDHNYFTDPQGLNSFLGARDRFLLITGEEVTSKYESKPIHINAFRLKETIQPMFGGSVLETIQANVDSIRGHGALPSLNHPNFGWAVTPDELAKVRNLPLFEVYNGHPGTNDFGGGGEAGLEEAWDHVLTAGVRSWGIAVDDAHSFKTFAPDLSNPGRGWIQVRAAELSESALLAAIEGRDLCLDGRGACRCRSRRGQACVAHRAGRQREVPCGVFRCGR